MYLTKNSSDVTIQNSLLHSHVSQMCVGLMGCDQGGRFKDNTGWGEANIMQDGAVDLQHWTGLDGIRICASKATTPSKGFKFKDSHIKLLYLLDNTILILYLFLLCRLKINHVKEQ